MYILYAKADGYDVCMSSHSSAAGERPKSVINFCGERSVWIELIVNSYLKC